MPDQPSDKTVALAREAAKLMGNLLIARKDVKAVFRPDHQGDWHWTAVSHPFKMDDIVKHLTSNLCLGTYMLDADSNVKFLAFDLDLSKDSKYLDIYDVEQIQAMQDAGEDFEGYGTTLGLHPGNLEAALHQVADPAHRWARVVLLEAIRAVNGAVAKQLELPTLTVITGGGAHVIVPLPGLTPAAEARSAGIEIAASIPAARQRNDIFFDYGAHNEISIEVFPKQDGIDGSKKFGNLIRLPFGWHYEAGVRTYAIDPNGAQIPQWEWSKISSIGALRSLAQTSGVG